MVRSLSLAVLVACALAALPAPGAAQSLPGTDPGGSVRTRADLERLLREYDQALASPAYSDAVKQGIRADAEMIRGRLQNGDFRVGDRITLEVSGEPSLPDTVTVEAGPMIVLPLFGEIPLAGVLRSEIQSHLTTELGRFIRDPIVRARGHMRLSVVGMIGRPGFYTVPAEMLLGDALMVAGGPTQASNLEGLRVERGSVVLLEGTPLQEAIRNGLTLDQLNLQAGDQIVVPERTTGGIWGRLSLIAGVVTSLGFVIFQLVS